MNNLVYSRNCFNLFSNEKGHSVYNNGDCILYSLQGKHLKKQNKKNKIL